jgi:hypothetical protein
MKNIWLFGVVLAVVALAQGQTAEIDTELMHFSYEKGAEVRFLQLELSIERNILTGGQVLEINPDPQLESILDDLRNLLEEVREVDMDKPASELAADFVVLKKQATELTSQFRQIASVNLSELQRTQINERTRNMEQVRSHEARITSAKNEFNANLLRNILNGLEAEDADMVQQLRNSQMNLEQVKNRLRFLFNELPAESKVRVTQRLQERVQEATAQGERARTQVREQEPRTGASQPGGLGQASSAGSGSGGNENSGYSQGIYGSNGKNGGN